MKSSTVLRILAVSLGLLAAPPALAAAAQPPAKVPRIGMLRAGSPPDPFVEAFRQGLRDLGYTEGQNIIIEYRWAEGRNERLPELAADLVRLKVDVILPGGNAATRAAKEATSTIPIVMAVTSNPEGVGFVASLARPGGNITGMATLFTELAPKRLQILKEAFPRVSRVGVLYDPAGDVTQLKETEAAARSLRAQLHIREVRSPKDFDAAFAEAKRAHVGALSVLASAMFSGQRSRIVALAAEHRLPAIYEHGEFVHAGGLMSYGPVFPELFRRAAAYVDKILKGAKPADLPVEQPMRFELVVNLKTAKALGLTFPQTILIRADQVIQ